MPNLVGKAKAEAESTLSSLGLKPSFSEQHSNTVASGRVISQNIAPGQQIGIDTVVAIVISKGKAGPDLVATVSASGIVTAVSAGSATITVTTQDGNKTASYNLTVKPFVKAIQLGAGKYGTLSPGYHLNNYSNGTTVYEFEFYTGSTIPANGYIFRYYTSDGSVGMGFYFNSSKQLAVHMRFKEYNGTMTATSTTFQPDTFYRIRVEFPYPPKKYLLMALAEPQHNGDYWLVPNRSSCY